MTLYDGDSCLRLQPQMIRSPIGTDGIVINTIIVGIALEMMVMMTDVRIIEPQATVTIMMTTIIDIDREDIPTKIDGHSLLGIHGLGDHLHQLDVIRGCRGRDPHIDAIDVVDRIPPPHELGPDLETGKEMSLHTLNAKVGIILDIHPLGVITIDQPFLTSHKRPIERLV